jgi:hypothetical protein
MTVSMHESKSDRLFYGKYRGKVTDNHDPMMLGRVRAKVPSVFGDQETGWALPNTPYGGSGVGFFFIPPIDANVWIEFEQGNPESPIWSGCFWGVGEAPKMPAVPEFKIIKTDIADITINDLAGAGGITIETKNGLKVVMDITGIELSNAAASIKLNPASVSVNNGALEVI